MWRMGGGPLALVPASPGVAATTDATAIAAAATASRLRIRPVSPIEVNKRYIRRKTSWNPAGPEGPRMERFGMLSRRSFLRMAGAGAGLAAIGTTLPALAETSRGTPGALPTAP